MAAMKPRSARYCSGHLIALSPISCVSPKPGDATRSGACPRSAPCGLLYALRRGRRLHLFRQWPLLLAAGVAFREIWVFGTPRSSSLRCQFDAAREPCFSLRDARGWIFLGQRPKRLFLPDSWRRLPASRCCQCEPRVFRQALTGDARRGDRSLLRWLSACGQRDCATG